jgi:CHASE2 domain-containing sensor protein
MINRPWPRLLLWGLVPTVAAAVLSLSRPAWLAGLERATYDSMVRAIPLRATSGRIAIVDIDDRALTTVGQWPGSSTA